MANRVYGGLSVAQRRAGRRERLLAAGFELFGTVGYLKTTIPMICNTAGVTARHFYDEFASREELLREILDDLAGRAYELVREALRATQRPVRDRVLASNRAYYAFFTHDPRRARIYAIECLGVSPQLEQHRRELRERSVRQLTRATQWVEREGISQDLDSRLVAVGLASGAVALLAEWVLADVKPDVETMAQTLTMFWTRTLRLEPTS
jgi:AcrR family transcriptional regulator